MVTQTEQLTLFPEDEITSIPMRIRVDQVRPPRGKASPGLIASVRKAGRVLQRPFVSARPDGEYPYTLVAGRRRILAALANGIEEVDVEVFDVSVPVAAILSLSENALRSPNVVSELGDIQTLLAEPRVRNLPEKERVSLITRETGMTAGEIKARLSLLSLDSALMQGVADGKIAPTVAGDLAKMPAELQAQAADVLKEKGKVTSTDVKGLKSVSLKRIQADMDDDMFPDAPPTANGEGSDWRTHTLAHIEQALRRLPADAPAATRDFLERSRASLFS